MIFQKHFSAKSRNMEMMSKTRGFIMYDIISALAISVVFVALTTQVSLQARKTFDDAKRRNSLIAFYKEHQNDFSDLMPYEERSRLYSVASSTAVVTISAFAKWYGNDRIETSLSIAETSSGGSRNNSLIFTTVRNYSTGNSKSSAGTSLCAVDLESKEGSILIQPVTLPIDPLLPLTDIIVRNGIAYISADSSTASDPDLLIVDIRNETSPMILSTLNTGPGLSAISLASDHIYAAAASTAAQLHVVKLNGLGSLYLSKKYQLPLPEASTSPPMASSIFYRDKKVYLGTERWDGQEFSIIDVAVPENPMKMSGYEVDSKVGGIYVRANTAYVAAAGWNQLVEIDVSGSEGPTVVNVFSPSGWQRQEGKDTSYFEDRLVLGRTTGGFNITNDKELFSFGSSTKDVRLAVDVAGGVYGSVSDRNRIFAATRALNQEFSVFNQLTGSTTAVYALPVLPQKITCDGHHLYILAKTAPVIYEINFVKQ